MERSYFFYFISTYLIFVFVFGFILIAQDSINLLDKTVQILHIPFLFSLFVAPILYYVYPPSDVHYRYRKHKKKVFKKFIEIHGFSTSENGYVFGVLENYHIMIHAARNLFPANNEWIEAKIVFHPKCGNQFISSSIIKDIQHKYDEKNVTWFLNSVKIKQPYVFTMPKHEALCKVLQSCISDLKAQNIKPIPFEEWSELIPELQAYTNSQKKL
ncbi:hypothetical protein KORDIASMS9_00204 [Kordia sp. SMS9]|uniref:hypothetical protein n=1 Tax=Kordia sp. SMS9 TaxID=2282170 RepID=UPI000E0D7D40|nr:hypothetical protein [Kordia sp. SMS9]AXG68020.1 hypothetical protein KORDIASMS9_00204 [Kordia sp. SMS9]